MGISFVSAATAASAAQNYISPNKPAGTQEKDVLVAYIFVEDTTDRINSVPSGWVNIINATVGARAIRQYVYYKVATGSEPDHYTWGLNATDEVIAIVATFRGVSVDSPIGNHSTSTDTASSASAIAPGITISEDGNYALHFAGNAYGTTWTEPTGYTEIADVYTGTSSSNISAQMSYRERPAGVTGDTTAVSANADYRIASLVELQQASHKYTGGLGLEVIPASAYELTPREGVFSYSGYRATELRPSCISSYSGNPVVFEYHGRRVAYLAPAATYEPTERGWVFEYDGHRVSGVAPVSIYELEQSPVLATYMGHRAVMLQPGMEVSLKEYEYVGNLVKTLSPNLADVIYYIGEVYSYLGGLEAKITPQALYGLYKSFSYVGNLSFTITPNALVSYPRSKTYAGNIPLVLQPQSLYRLTKTARFRKLWAKAGGTWWEVGA
jgi:hypothetical protein